MLLGCRFCVLTWITTVVWLRAFIIPSFMLQNDRIFVINSRFLCFQSNIVCDDYSISYFFLEYSQTSSVALNDGRLECSLDKFRYETLANHTIVQLCLNITGTLFKSYWDWIFIVLFSMLHHCKCFRGVMDWFLPEYIILQQFFLLKQFKWSDFTDTVWKMHRFIMVMTVMHVWYLIL